MAPPKKQKEPPVTPKEQKKRRTKGHFIVVVKNGDEVVKTAKLVHLTKCRPPYGDIIHLRIDLDKEPIASSWSTKEYKRKSNGFKLALFLAWNSKIAGHFMIEEDWAALKELFDEGEHVHPLSESEIKRDEGTTPNDPMPDHAYVLVAPSCELAFNESHEVVAIYLRVDDINEENDFFPIYAPSIRVEDFWLPKVLQKRWIPLPWSHPDPSVPGVPDMALRRQRSIPWFLARKPLSLRKPSPFRRMLKKKIGMSSLLKYFGKTFERRKPLYGDMDITEREANHRMKSGRCRETDMLVDLAYAYPDRIFVERGTIEIPGFNNLFNVSPDGGMDDPDSIPPPWITAAWDEAGLDWESDPGFVQHGCVEFKYTQIAVDYLMWYTLTQVYGEMFGCGVYFTDLVRKSSTKPHMSVYRVWRNPKFEALMREHMQIVLDIEQGKLKETDEVVVKMRERYEKEARDQAIFIGTTLRIEIQCPSPWSKACNEYADAQYTTNVPDDMFPKSRLTRCAVCDAGLDKLDVILKKNAEIKESRKRKPKKTDGSAPVPPKKPRGAAKKVASAAVPKAPPVIKKRFMGQVAIPTFAEQMAALREGKKSVPVTIQMDETGDNESTEEMDPTEVQAIKSATKKPAPKRPAVPILVEDDAASSEEIVYTKKPKTFSEKTALYKGKFPPSVVQVPALTRSSLHEVQRLLDGKYSPVVMSQIAASYKKLSKMYENAAKDALSSIQDA